jgi:hypothetical protein
MDLLIKLSTIAAALGTAWAALIITATAIIYALQLKAMKKARQLESLLRILQYVDSPDLRRGRWFVYEHSESLKPLLDSPFSWEQRRRIDDKIKQLSFEKIDLHQVDLSLNAMNNIAYLIREGYAPYEIVPKFLKNTLLRCSVCYGPYIQYRRKYRLVANNALESSASLYGQHLELLAHEIRRSTELHRKPTEIKESPTD